MCLGSVPKQWMSLASESTTEQESAVICTMNTVVQGGHKNPSVPSQCKTSETSQYQFIYRTCSAESTIDAGKQCAAAGEFVSVSLKIHTDVYSSLLPYFY